MQQTVVTIVNPLGLHARAAAQVVSLCSRYISNIVLSAGDCFKDHDAQQRDIVELDGPGLERERSRNAGDDAHAKCEQDDDEEFAGLEVA